ncbi:MAG: hypothetical protein KGH61_03480 [Candidatus Micrarchaeota archaeon]|nr:hypothetical protein [Candidatus Micrarchaeota archaeon]MDE1847984.1 hypothetical protein [Candidatus Micrarchaeota archaeon]MDE1864673.1 hypothetical protein [Candidatus Micrarchaeota archaeon]
MAELGAPTIFYLCSAALPILLFLIMLLYATGLFAPAIPALKAILGIVSIAFGITGFLEVFVNGKRGW